MFSRGLKGNTGKKRVKWAYNADESTTSLLSNITFDDEIAILNEDYDETTSRHLAVEKKNEFALKREVEGCCVKS